MKKFKIFSVIIFFILSFLMTTAFAENNTQYLFIQTAKSGVIQLKKEQPEDNEYVLVLHEVDPYVTYFSNVPKRVTGFLSMQKFLKIMQQEVTTKYAKGLNSGLIALTGNQHQSVRYIFSLKNPKYDASSNTLVYDAIIVPGDKTHTLPNSIAFQHIALFVDSACISCGGGGF